jgi:hypothetical protein
MAVLGGNVFLPDYFTAVLDKLYPYVAKTDFFGKGKGK